MEFLLRHLLMTHFGLLLPSCCINCSLPLSPPAVCPWEESLPKTSTRTGVCRPQLEFPGNIITTTWTWVLSKRTPFAPYNIQKQFITWTLLETRAIIFLRLEQLSLMNLRTTRFLADITNHTTFALFSSAESQSSTLQDKHNSYFHLVWAGLHYRLGKNHIFRANFLRGKDGETFQS